MSKGTIHTALVKILSGTSSRGEVVFGHQAIHDPSKFSDEGRLRYAQFSRYEEGDLVVVRVKLTGSRRTSKWVAKDPDINNVSDFLKQYGEQLHDEASMYERAHGIPIGSTAPFPDPKMFDDVVGEGTWIDYFAKASRASKAMSRDDDRYTPDKSDWHDDVWAEDEPQEDADESPYGDVEKWVKEIYVDSQDRKLFGTMRELAKKRHVAMMMIGPSGYGKTSIPQQMAKEWGMEFLRWDCATVRDPEEFFGFRGALDGSTLDDDGNPIFMKSNFTEVVEKGNAVIVLDELNRIDPYISNILFPLLDHAGRASVVGYNIEVGPNVLFVATINLGYQFTGTFTLDTALTNRFSAKVLVEALPVKIEEQIVMARGDVEYKEASQIVELMGRLRRLNRKGELSIDASTRVSIQIGELMGCGLDLRTSLVYVITNGISEDESKLVVDELGYVLS